jgi:hypothetical protein
MLLIYSVYVFAIGRIWSIFGRLLTIVRLGASATAKACRQKSSGADHFQAGE